MVKTPLALLNLVHEKTRTLLAVAGVAFAIILIFMQLGFRGSAEATATLVYDRLGRFDIVLVSSDFLDMNRPSSLPRDRLYQAMGVEGVESAAPLYINFQQWRNPLSGQRRNIMLLGFRLSERVFQGLPELEDERVLRKLQKPNTVLIDRRSHPDFGLENGALVTGDDITELGASQIEIVGQFTLGTGFASDGAVITSAESFARILGGYPLDRVNFGLIKLSQGADSNAVQTNLRRLLPRDVLVRTRVELEEQEKDFWLHDRPIGILFNLGVLIAFVVGVVFVYQIISNDIANHLAEYATLKAIGYGESYLAKIVLQQAFFLAVLGYVPGLAIASFLYFLARLLARVPIFMDVERATGVFVLALAMCALSGLFSLQKVRSADPADLF